MPKEISHWTLAAGMAEKLAEKSLFTAAVHEYPHLFLYGAVAPDTPFTYVTGPDNAWIQELAGQFHQTDEKALAPIFRLLKSSNGKDAAACAFAAGMVCHVISDTVFHPLVEYFTGHVERHKGAITRHHLFETALDYYFWKHSDDFSRVSLTRIFQKLETPKSRLIDDMKTMFGIQQDQRSRVMKFAVISHVVLHGLFRSRCAVRFFNILYQKKWWVPSQNQALLYPFASPVTLPFFENSIQYKDVQDGREIHTTIRHLSDQVVDSSICLLNLMEVCLTSGSHLESALDHPKRPLISPGLTRENFNYWSGQRDLQTILFNNMTLEPHLERLRIHWI